MMAKRILLIVGGLLLVGGLAYGISQYRKLMDYEIQPLDPKTLSRQGRTYKILVPVLFKNKSSLGYKLKNQRYKIFIGSLLVGEGKSEKEFNILPKKESKFEFVLDFTVPQLSRSISLLTEFLANPFINLEIEWDVDFMGLNVPIQEKFKIKV
jgi:hypothetical protein